MPRNFNQWLDTFKRSISTFGYYVDFAKVLQNVETYRVELNILNSLLGSNSIEEDFSRLVHQYPRTLSCIPLLLAVRGQEIFVRDGENEFLYNFNQQNYSIEKYCYFMKKTGLFELLSNRTIGNLVDYVTGVETGLDSNARKNRGGKLMEALVTEYLERAGFILNESYFEEMYNSEIRDRWSIDLSAITNNNRTKKRFDFVVKTDSFVYAIEANFYASGGSKLNEVARSYKNIALEARAIDNFKFIWITDGAGWENAKHNLEETFDILPSLYNIADLEQGILQQILV